MGRTITIEAHGFRPGDRIFAPNAPQPSPQTLRHRKIEAFHDALRDWTKENVGAAIAVYLDGRTVAEKGEYYVHKVGANTFTYGKTRPATGWFARALRHWRIIWKKMNLIK